MTSHRATAYIVAKATRYQWGTPDPETGLNRIDAVRAIAIRRSRPSKLERDEIAIKVTIEIPDAAFNPITPSALIVVPTDLALPGPIGVEAVDANDGGEQ